MISNFVEPDIPKSPSAEARNVVPHEASPSVWLKYFEGSTFKEPEKCAEAIDKLFAKLSTPVFANGAFFRFALRNARAGRHIVTPYSGISVTYKDEKYICKYFGEDLIKLTTAYFRLLRHDKNVLDYVTEGLMRIDYRRTTLGICPNCRKSCVLTKNLKIKRDKRTVRVLCRECRHAATVLSTHHVHKVQC